MGLRELLFDTWYRLGNPHWTINTPQPDLIRAHREGFITGPDVLDMGCGIGDNAIHLASTGLHVLGVDSSAKAISIARRKVHAGGHPAEFKVMDVFKLYRLEKQFDTVLDFGLLHLFGGSELPRYIRAVEGVTRPSGKLLLQCFSDRNERRSKFGPRLLSQREIRKAFEPRWRVEWIRPAIYKARQRDWNAWQAYLTLTNGS